VKDYILSIDQSTSATKVCLFDENGRLVARNAVPHRQYVNEKGWVEHDPEEIYHNIVVSVASVICSSGVDSQAIAAVGLSNQRETTILWDARNGEPVYRAIVWQCGRAKEICERLKGAAQVIKEKTGLNLSPYFSAAKMRWIVENVPRAEELRKEGFLVASTIDAWLLFKMSGGQVIRTDLSNASRTQLLDIFTKKWMTN